MSGRGDHDAVAVVECDEAAVEGVVVQRVEQKAVRQHEAAARRGRRPRLDVARREQLSGRAKPSTVSISEAPVLSSSGSRTFFPCNLRAEYRETLPYLCPMALLN